MNLISSGIITYYNYKLVLLVRESRRVAGDSCRELRFEKQELVSVSGKWGSVSGSQSAGSEGVSVTGPSSHLSHVFYFFC